MLSWSHLNIDFDKESIRLQDNINTTSHLRKCVCRICHREGEAGAQGEVNFCTEHNSSV